LDSLTHVLKEGSCVLAAAGIDTPEVDAELLAAHALSITRSELKHRLILDLPMDDDFAATFQKLIAERATRKPLQHITGKAPFRYLELNVGPGVFIPRPETESVVGAAIEWLNHRAANSENKGPAIVVDLCTGSAAIAIAIATECPDTQVYAVELNDKAYEWANQNVKNLAPKIRLIKGDALKALPELNGQVDLVISNPPYLAPSEVPPDKEVHAHDPAMALYGQGEDGSAIPKGIVQTAIRLLKPGGLLVMEHGDTQAESLINAITETKAFTELKKNQDLTGRDRFISAKTR
jgi:release factor glutamine methyltransferase